MDHPIGQRILHHLEEVATLRHSRQGTPGLQERAHAVKQFQHERFRQTYSDLAAQARYALATRFFLDELYGPGDFTRRDAQFARIVPKLVKLFPQQVVETVGELAELHALTERLDTAMARQMGDGAMSAAGYVGAWQSVGEEASRRRQIDLVLGIGRDLETFTRMPLLMTSLRIMRGPARAAGLSDLQHFLETGLGAFREMRGSHEFLGVVGQREIALSDRLFQPDAVACVAQGPQAGDPLGQLPLMRHG